MTVVFILNGTSSFPDPGNWNPVNTVEIVGAGGRGFGRDTLNTTGSASGGAGAYAIGSNLNPMFPVTVSVSAEGGATGVATNSKSYWNANTATVGNVYADDGNRVSTGTAGRGGQLFYPSGFAGGSGQNAGLNGNIGAGGGGAGGPHGAGASGGTGTTNYYGGSADGGTTAGQTVSGNPGNSGTQWDASHGCGGGGSGANTSTVKNGSNAGNYGGGGGGAFYVAGSLAGLCAPGLMIITYVPFTPAVQYAAMVMA